MTRPRLNEIAELRGDVRRAISEHYALGWSNHYPDRTVEQRAQVDVSNIPSWCVPGYEDDEEERRVGEWLRLGLWSWDHEYEDPERTPTKRLALDVVMDETAVTELVKALTNWLNAPKLYATKGAPHA